MSSKILITYDIAETDENQRDNVINYIKAENTNFHAGTTKWIHLQDSVWVIYTAKLPIEVYKNLKSMLSERSLLAVINISERPIFTKKYLEHKDNASKILFEDERYI